MNTGTEKHSPRPSMHAVFRVALIAVLALVGCAGAELLPDASIPDQGEEDVLLPQILHLSGEDAEATAPDGASAVDSDASAPPPAADPVDAEGQSAEAPTAHFALAEPAVLMPGGVFTITAVVRGAPAIGGVVRAGGIERAFDWSTGRTWTAEVPWWTFEPLALAPDESIRFGAELIFVDAQGREGRAAAPIELHLSCQCPGGEACDGSGCLLPDPPCIEPGCPPGERCAYICERIDVCLNTTGSCTDACVSGNPLFDCLDDESRRLAEPDPCIAWPACLEAAR